MPDALQSLLYLSRSEIRTVEERTDGLAPGRYVRVLKAPAPGLVAPLLIFIVGTSVAGLFLYLALISLGLGPPGAATLPALILGLSSAIRGGLKVRERMAEAVGWPDPVGRQRPGVRVAAGLIGLALGALAGFLLSLAISPRLSPLYFYEIPLVLGTVECVRNCTRIGRVFGLGGVDEESYVRWMRIPPGFEASLEGAGR